MRMHGCGHGGRAKWPMAAMMFGIGGRGWGRGFGGSFGDDFGAGFGDSFGGRHGRGRRGRVFGSGELRLALLGLIAEQPRHGYELIKAIEELSGGAYAPSPGVVYPTLQLMADEGVVAEAAGDSARRSYAATDSGHAELADRADDYAALVARLKALGAEGERHNAPPLKRAIGNLFAAVRNRAMEDGFDRETMHQVAEILDEAARKVERL